MYVSPLYGRMYHNGGNRRKYGNQKPTYNGVKFDSKAEMMRYIQLSDMEAKGEISQLRMQVPYELQPSFKIENKTIRAIKYVADFVYIDKDGKEHIEDVKGMETKEYILKRKMMAYRGYIIEEPNKRKKWYI